MKRILLVWLIFTSAVYADVIPFQQPVSVPPHTNQTSGIPTNTTQSTVTIDATGEKVGAIFLVNKGGNIQNVAFGIGTATTGATFDVRCEQLSATGVPNGTLWATDTSGTITIADTDDNVMVESGNLTANATVVAGDVIGCFMERTSAGSIILETLADEFWETLVPISSNSASGFTKIQGYPQVALKYSDGSYEFPGPNQVSGLIDQSQTATNATNPNYVGQRFKLPYAARAVGMWAWMDAEADPTFHISDGSNVFLATATITSGYRQQTGGNVFRANFNTPVSISSGTYYWMFSKPNTASTDTYYGYGVSSTMNDSYYDIQFSTAQNPTSSANWGVNPNRKLWMGLLLDQISTPASSGGTTVNVYSD